MNITDDEILEKIYSIFHASYIILQQQYQLHGFKKYSKLISSLLVAKKNNKVFIKNHQSRLTGSGAFSKANAIISRNYG